MAKTLFLSPLSFDDLDGGSGSRYQARCEVTSYWYPTSLVQPAALVEFVLDSSLPLSPSSWTAVSWETEIVAGLKRMSLSGSDSHLFFRLGKL